MNIYFELLDNLGDELLSRGVILGGHQTKICNAPQALERYSQSIPEPLASSFLMSYEEAVEFLRKKGIEVAEGDPDEIGNLISIGVTDAFLADHQLIDLKPHNIAPNAAPFSSYFKQHLLPNGRSVWTGPPNGRDLVIVGALGVSIELWSHLFSDASLGVRPVIVETKCGNVFGGEVQSSQDALAHASDILESLYAIGVQRYDLICWCNAGRIGLIMATLSDDIRTLTLLSPTMKGFNNLPGSQFEEELAHLFSAVEAKPRIAEIISRKMLQSADEIIQVTAEIPATFRKFLGAPNANAKKALVAPMSRGQGLINYARRTKSDETILQSPALAKIGCPVTLITGDSDEVVNNETAAIALRSVPALTHYEICGSGHYIHHMQYRYFKEIIFALLNTEIIPSLRCPLRISRIGGHYNG